MSKEKASSEAAITVDDVDAVRDIVSRINAGHLDPAVIKDYARCVRIAGSMYTCRGMLSQLSKNISSWRKEKGFRTDWLNVPEKQMLIVCELAEAMEAYRHLTPETLSWLHENVGATDFTELQPEQRKHYENFAEELADTLIRTLDLAASLGIQIELATALKMGHNELRPPMHNKHR